MMEKHIKVYFNDPNYTKLYKIKSNKTYVLLMKLAELTEYNTNIAKLTPEDNKQLAKSCKLSMQALSKAKKDLRELGLIEGKTIIKVSDFLWHGDHEVRQELYPF